jgi:hypothetical protein
VGELFRLVMKGVELLAGVVERTSPVLGLSVSARESVACAGMLAGVIMISVVAFVGFRIHIWWKGFTNVFRPQVVVHRTDRTPWQVFWNSVLKLIALLIVALLVLLFVLGRNGILSSWLASLL